VVEYHSYLKTLLEEKLQQEVKIIEKPIYVVSYGAALIAKQNYLNKPLTVEGSELSSTVVN